MDVVFTPAAILELLNQIDELKDYDLGLTETLDGKLQLQVGESAYEINTDNVEEVDAPEELVDTVESINEDAYADLVGSGEFDETDTQDLVEAGLIKEAIKSMLLGGAIKFIKKLL